MISQIKIACFLSLAETLSFTETAKRLGMSQQAVSRHIALLEEHFGFPLFSRTKRIVGLTKAGEACLALFSGFRREYDGFVAGYRADYRRERGLLRVGYQNWWNFGSAPARAGAALRERFPDFRMVAERYSPGLLQDRLLQGELDLILIHRRYAPEAPGLRSLDLMRMPLMLLVSAENPAARPGATCADFLAEPFLIDAFENETPEDSQNRAHREIALYGLRPGRILVLPNRESVYTAAELGHGIMIGTDTSQMPRKETILSFPIGVTETLACFWREEESGMAREFAARLREEYRARGAGEEGARRGE